MIKKKLISSILSAVFCVGVALPSANASGETKLLLGDANMNSTVDSADASLILSEYSTVSTGGAATFDSAQKQCADVDGNNAIDSVDASYVLAYYAYISTGGTAEFIDFINGGQEPEYEEYTLEDIGTNHGAFELYAQYLTNDIMAGNALSMSYTDYTPGGRESLLLLAMLNEGYINDGVLAEVFCDYTYEELKNYTEFIYSLADIQDMFGTVVDFSKYTLNSEIGDYINSIDNAYRNDEIEVFLYDVYMNCNIPEEYIYNSAVMSIMCSYDKENKYMREEFVDIDCVDDFINNLYSIIEKSKSET